MGQRNSALQRWVLMPFLLLVLSACVTNEAANWFNKGIEASNGDEKIANFTRAIELNHEMAAGFKGRALAYNDLGRADKAIADQKTAKAFDWDQSAALVNRGIAYKNKGRFDLAIQDYDEAIHFTPDMAQAYGNRGNAYDLKGLYEKAINDQTRSITLAKASDDDHSLILGYFSRGHAYQSKGSYNLTIRDMNEVLKIAPNNAHARAHLAWVRAAAPDAVFRDGKLAVEDAEKAAGLELNAFNLAVLAAAYAEVGRFDKAIKSLAQVNELLNRMGGEGSLAEFEKHRKRYGARKPWRMSHPAGGPDYTTTVIQLNDRAERARADGKIEEAGRLEKKALAVGEKGRRQEQAKISQKQQIEALSGRYSTAGGRSQWQINFRNGRFEARYLSRSGWSNFFSATVTGTEINGRYDYHGDCQKASTIPLQGRIDLNEKSFRIVKYGHNKRRGGPDEPCVPKTTTTKWYLKDRQ